MRVIIGSIDPIYHSPPISTTLRTTFDTGVSCYWYSRILAFGDLCCLRVDSYSSIPSLSRLLSYGRFECILKMSYWSYACTISHQSACLRPTRIAEIVQSCLCPTNIICCSDVTNSKRARVKNKHNKLQFYWLFKTDPSALSRGPCLNFRKAGFM